MFIFCQVVVLEKLNFNKINKLRLRLVSYPIANKPTFLPALCHIIRTIYLSRLDKISLIQSNHPMFGTQK